VELGVLAKRALDFVVNSPATREELGIHSQEIPAPILDKFGHGAFGYYLIYDFLAMRT
jgi:hypothetical protein